MRVDDVHRIDVVEDADAGTRRLAEQPGRDVVVAHDHLGRRTERLREVHDALRLEAARVQPAHVEHEQGAQLRGREARAGLGGEAVGDEVDGLVERPGGPGCDGVEAARLATHRDGGDGEDGDGRDRGEGELDAAQMPMRWASSSRWYVGSP